MTKPVQLPLFGAQMVHLGHRGVCVMCGVLLAMAEVYDDCGSCPGFVSPAPPWSLLGTAEPLLEHLESERAA